MKGVIFNILEDFISQNYGEDQLEKILSHCPLQTKEPFVGPGTYPDADLFAIVSMTVRHLNVSAEDCLRQLGKFSFSKLLEKLPPQMNRFSHPKELLLAVDSIIHVEVKKFIRDAETPKFTYQDLGPTQLIMHYSSKRKLCHFMEGLLEGLGEHFNSPIHYEQKACMHLGNPTCDFHLTFPNPLN